MLLISSYIAKRRTLNQRLVAGLVEVDDRPQIFGPHLGSVVAAGEHEAVEQVLDGHPSRAGEVGSRADSFGRPLRDFEVS